MTFSSIEFIFLFLPVTLLIFYLSPRGGIRNAFLVLASLVFLGWVDPGHLPVLILLTLVNYGLARWMGLAQERDQQKVNRVLLWMGVLVDLGALFAYKYLGFFGSSLAAIFRLSWRVPDLLLPLGISYLTFSALSYLLDVYHGVEKAERNLLNFSVYLLMFPKLVQGPITRYQAVRDQLHTPVFNLENLMEGARRFIIGLAKKVLLADVLAAMSAKIFSVSPTLLGADLAWLGVLSFSLQIYFDFSGYTDMALGLGRMLGFSLPENFNFPYISRSITDFWRRWHMSLTAWFRTYVFIPLEFARRREKVLRQQTDILIVFLLTGLWHGASWNFVLWGGYFGLILALESGWFGRWLKRMPVVLQHSYALLLIALGWAMFKLTDLTLWKPFFGALFGFHGWTGVENLRSVNVVMYFPIMILAAIFSVPVFARLDEHIQQGSIWLQMAVDVVYLAIFLLSIAYLLTNGFTPFMYAQF